MKFTFTGWKAIVAIAAVSGFAVIRYGMQSAALQTEGVAEVQRWLALEAARAALPDLKSAAASGSGVLEQMVNDLEAANFDVISVTRHGVGEEVVVRVAYRHTRRSSDTRVRYLRMSYSLPTGWRIRSETTRMVYYLAVF